MDAPKLERTDALLQLSRRVDWRFLLPSPVLGSVGFFGPERCEHLRALQALSSSVTVLEPQTCIRAQFDVVVLHADSQIAPELAYKFIRSGGFINWEIDRKAWFKNGTRMRAFQQFDGFLKTAQNAGFQQPEAYWHRPNFKSCLEIIPLKDQASLEAAFGKRGGNLKKQMKFWFGNFLWKSGLLNRVAPCVSIIGKKN